MLLSVLSAPAAPETATSETSKFDELFLRADLWGMSKDDFVRAAANHGFRWVSTAKDAARSTSPGTFMGEKALEVIVRFGTNTVSEVQLSFYNRGDAGDIAEEAYEQKVARIDGKIRGLAGKPVKEISPRETNNSERKSITAIWMNAGSVLRFEHAYTRVRNAEGRRSVRPEFVNLTLLKNEKSLPSDLVRDAKIDVGAMGLKKLVKRSGNGDVVMDSVPMVDQGQKGYCAVATTERVLRYYGTDVNQHELAQRANTASGGGTDPVSLAKALKAMASPMRLRIKTLMQSQVPEYTKLVDDYNKAAKKQKLPPVVLAVNGVIDVTRIMDSMDKDVFLKVRGKNPAALDKFMKLVTNDVNEGHPILWGVTLGFIPEKPELPQAMGGHVRLIIGYNLKTGEILYSDSWGAGHELKRMKVSDAYAITSSLTVIAPI